MNRFFKLDDFLVSRSRIRFIRSFEIINIHKLLGKFEDFVEIVLVFKLLKYLMQILLTTKI